MSAMYSTLAFATSVAAGTEGASYGPRNESSASLVLGAFNALGTIMFAFGGHAILLEVQVGTRLPHAPLQQHNLAPSNAPACRDAFAAKVCLAYGNGA